jgi:hypothetical protein
MVAAPPPVVVILNAFQHDASAPLRTFVILNLFQDNRRRYCVILKQVQDDDSVGIGVPQHTQHDDGWRFLHSPLKSAA